MNNYSESSVNRNAIGRENPEKNKYQELDFPSGSLIVNFKNFKI